MTDQYGRRITYLRLSVTELCNLRCRYCMPEDGVCKKRHDEMLSQEEMLTAIRAAAELGIRKLRITGGEPLIKPDIVELCARAAEVENIREICLTANGVLLPKLAKPLREAGVRRLNISLDTLREDTFQAITRRGELRQTLDGLAAAEAAGFTGTKINTVLLGGINDGEIGALAGLTREKPVSVRFIELMPMGVCADWPQERFISADTVLQAMPQLEPIGTDGVAELYRVPGWVGTVGLIRPLSHCFCDRCNRIRVTADGRLKPCLHSDREIPLRGLSGEALERAIREAAAVKPDRHHLAEHHSDSRRNMNEIGG